MSGAARSGEAGFTLLEALVAFAVAALALGLLYRGGAEALSAERVAAVSVELVSRAQSRLAALCHGGRLEPSRSEGDDGGGYRWTSRVSEIGSATIANDDDAGQQRSRRVKLYAVEVGVGRAGRSMSLATSCLAIGVAGTL